jgi:hypothetical protein
MPRDHHASRKNAAAENLQSLTLSLKLAMRSGDANRIRAAISALENYQDEQAPQLRDITPQYVDQILH